MTEVIKEPKKRSRVNLIILIAFLVLLIVLGGYWVYMMILSKTSEVNDASQVNQMITEQKEEQKIKNTQNIITYENEGRIYLYNIETKTTEELKLIDEPKKEEDRDYYRVREPAWSPNGRYLAYRTAAGGVALYDPLDKNNIKLQAIFEQIGFSYAVGWSPNSKFLTIKAGSGEPGAVTIIDIAADKKVGNHNVSFSAREYWSKDSKKILIGSPKDTGLKERAFVVQAGEYTSDLAMIEVSGSETKEKILKNGDSLVAYTPYSFTEDGHPRYIKKTYQSEKTSEYTESYWIFNEDANDIQIEKDESLVIAYDKPPFQAVLPDNLNPKIDPSTARLSSDKNWVTFTTYYPQGIYFMRYNQPKTAEKISDGQNPSWQPY